jgi:transcription antitermination factor NusG
MGSYDHGVSWYAIQVRQRAEFSTATILIGKGLEPFVPKYQTTRQWSDRKVKVDLPLFPGYIFCRFNAAIQMPVLTTAGVVRIVGIGSRPLPIDPEEIATIQRIAGSGRQARPYPFLATSERVRIETGPLAGLEGIIKGQKNHWLILSISLVQQSICIQVDDACVSFIPPACNRVAPQMERSA